MSKLSKDDANRLTLNAIVARDPAMIKKIIKNSQVDGQRTYTDLDIGILFRAVKFMIDEGAINLGKGTIIDLEDLQNAKLQEWQINAIYTSAIEKVQVR